VNWQHLKPLRVLWHGATLLGVAIIALAWTGLYFQLQSERRIAELAVAENSANLASAFEKQFSASLDELDWIIRSLRLRYLRNPEGFDLIAALNLSVPSIRPLIQAAFIGPDGYLKMTSLPGQFERLYLGDREHFGVHVGTKLDTLFISKPVVGRASGKPSIQLSRRIEFADGSFGGVIVVSLDPSFFARFYESISTGSDGYIKVVGTDGIVRVAGGSKPQRIGNDLSSLPVFSTYQDRRTGSFYAESGEADGVPRLVTYRVVEGYPLVVLVGIAESDVFAAVRGKRRMYLLAAAAFSIVILIITGLTLRGSLLLQKAVKRTEDQNLSFGAALSNMSQGLAMFDEETRLVLCNDRYLQIYGMSPDFAKPGIPFVDILRGLDQNHLMVGDPEKYAARILADIATGQTLEATRQTTNGHTIRITYSAMANGGWVSTHEDITEQLKAQQEIATLAHYDTLTELPNRAHFNEVLDQALTLTKRNGELALLYLDLDHFKRVNDTLGHLVGDNLLKEVAARLRGCVRETDVVARLGGDEFAVLQTSLEEPTDAVALASRIDKALTAPFDLNGHRAVIGVSIGIARAPDDAIERDQLLKNADLALYGAKDQGRGTYHFYEPGLDKRMKDRQRLETDLREALAKGQFELYYQPIIDLATGHITGCEALLRWHHPERGMISPADFIPIAEDSGLIVPIGDWVLRRACADARHWPEDLRVSVNLSSAQMKGNRLVPHIVSALASAGLAAPRLEIEITETALMQDTAANLATLHQLRELGVRIAMDDFGTGYSSLSYLAKFPFHKIKIDRSFVRELLNNDNNIAIVQSITDMARKLGMTTTVEGVETEDQRRAVQELGCTEMQGYLFSPPRPLNEVLRLFANRRARAMSAA
jgi:diguanylate cyclase (GGDEF)-like protein